MSENFAEKIAKDLGAERVAKVNVIPGVPPVVFPVIEFEIVPVYVIRCWCRDGDSCEACRGPDDYYTIIQGHTLAQIPIGVVVRNNEEFIRRVRKITYGGINTEYHLTNDLQRADRMDHDSAVVMIKEIKKILGGGHDNN